MGEDLISRQAAIDALGEAPAAWDELTTGYELGQRIQWGSDKLAIENVPSAQKRGKWQNAQVSSEGVEEWQAAQCSVCKRWHTTPYAYYFDHYQYCPNCGAKMRETEA